MARQATPDLLAEALPADDPSLAAMIGTQSQRIATVLIRLDGGTQPRSGIDQAVVDDYAADMATGAQFPPVELVYDGTDYWLWDGFHRFHAWRRDGDRAIPANVRQGTRRDAVLLSVGANATHGFRRTNADKRRAVLALLEDEEWRQWSDREIARRCAVDHRFVGNMRQELSPGDGPQVMERRGGDGKVYHFENTAQRPAEPALASQEATWLTADQIVVLLDQWCEQFEEPDQALARLHDEAGEGAGDTLDDWTNWVTGKWSLPRLFQALAALRLLPDEDEVHEPEGKLWDPPDSAKFVKEPRPPEPWTNPASLRDYTITIWCGDSRQAEYWNRINPAHLVITSPPYNVGIDYDNHDDTMTPDDYFRMLETVFANCYKSLVPGGRIAIVVPFGVGRNPWQPLAYPIALALGRVGFTLRGQIIWDKGSSGNRTSWGSWRSPTDPSLRDTCEAILIGHKEDSKASFAHRHLVQDGNTMVSPWLSSELFMELTQDHWKVAPESASRIGHPAPFPVELAKRLLCLYGWPGCHVVDPFAGSGTVGVAAATLGAKATLIDIDEGYCRIAARRCCYDGR